jgi:hypothetical protein
MQTNASLDEQKLRNDEIDFSEDWQSLETMILKTVLDDHDTSTHSYFETTGSSSSRVSLSQIDFEVERQVVGFQLQSRGTSSQSSWSSYFSPIQPPATFTLHDSTNINIENSRTEESSISNSSADSDCSIEDDFSQVCPFFLKGKCRYKRKCKMSHRIDKCPYCKKEMPSGMIASSTHLSRCWKKHCIQ